MKRLLLVILMIGIVSSASDVSVYQGQYYEGDKFMIGEYNFSFNVYDSLNGGNLVYSRDKVLSTGKFGEWYIELSGLQEVAHDPGKSYFMEILIDGKVQGERRRLTQLDFVRKDGRQVVDADTTFSSVLNVTNKSYFKNIEVDGKRVCLEDGNGCPNFSIEKDPVFSIENKSIWKILSGIVLNLSNYVSKSELNYFSGDYNDLRNKPIVLNDTRLSEAQVDLYVSNNGYLSDFNESDPVWNKEKGGYYSKEEIDNFLDSKISLPILISSNPWFKINKGMLFFNEKRLINLVDSRMSFLNLAGYYKKEEVNKLISKIPVFDASKYYTSSQIGSLIHSSGNRVFYGYSSKSKNIKKVWTDISFDKIVRKDDGFSLREENRILFDRVGWYEVSFGCEADVTGSSRYHVDWRAVKNGKEILGSRAASYHRVRGDGRDSVSVSFLEKFDSGDSLGFQGYSDDNRKVFSVANGCRVLIKSLDSNKVDDKSSYDNQEKVVEDKDDSVKVKSFKRVEFLKDALILKMDLNDEFSKDGFSWVKDSSENGHDGKVVGAVLGEGKFGKGIVFDGKGDYVDVDLEIPSSVSISAWARSSASYFADMLWCIGNKATGGPDLFFYNKNIYFNTWDGSHNPFCAIPDDVEGWHLYTTVIKKDNTALYIDGKLCGKAVYKNPSRDSFAISSSNGYDWQGAVDDVRIWNRALSEKEVLELYSLGGNKSFDNIIEKEVSVDMSSYYNKSEIDELVNGSLVLGSVRYNIDERKLEFYNGSGWEFVEKNDVVVPGKVEGGGLVIKESGDKVVKKKNVSRVAVKKESSESGFVKKKVDNRSSVGSEVKNKSDEEKDSGEKEDVGDKDEKGLDNEEVKKSDEDCKEVCEDKCSVEKVCKDVEKCEPVCEEDEDGKEVCKDECSSEEVCDDVEKCEPVCEEKCSAPEQLFDIRMDLEDSSIARSQDLRAVVTYESFGSVPTPVNLTFEVFDSDGKLVYSRDGFIVVRVEEIKRYEFSDLDLADGEYEFVFSTLYNVDVVDEFRQKFVVGREGFFEKVWNWVRFWN